MAQIKLAEYIFDNSVGDCLPTLEPNTIVMTSKDNINGTTTTRTVYIDDGVSPTKISFQNNNSLVEVCYLKIDNSMTSMAAMFHSCKRLSYINTSDWDTSNIISMQEMFYSCNNLISLDTSSFNTSKVTNMKSMFRYCQALTSLDLSSFNTSEVNNMNGMFYNCYSLTSLNISNFDTNNVTDFSYMFYKCSKIASLDLSSFDTGSVTKMNGMFDSCTSTQKVYISSRWTLGTSFPPTFIITFANTIAKYKFNQNIYESFIPEFNTEFTDYTYNDEIDTDGYTIRTLGNDSGNLPTLMRFGQVTVNGETGATNKSLSLLEIYECNTSNITSMHSMFRYCTNLTLLDVSSFNTSDVTYMGYMFQFCTSLASLDISNWNTSNVNNMNNMFSNCTSLTSLYLSNFDTSSVTSMYSMFNNCSKLTSLDLSDFNTGNVANMKYMFNNCTSLTSLDLSSFNTSKVTNMGYMFQNCTKLTSLDLSNFNTGQVTDMSYMFSNCTKLTELDLLSFDTKKVTDKTTMFGGWDSSQKVYISSRWTLGTSFPPTFIITFANIIARYKFNQNTYANLLPVFNSQFTDYTTADEIDTDGYTIRTIGNDSGNLPTSMTFGTISESASARSLLEVYKCNTSNITDMNNMFRWCTALTSLNTSGFNTSKVTGMTQMFYHCFSLTSLDLSNFNTSQVTNMQQLFFGCSKLTSLDISNFNTSQVTNMLYMFSGCSLLPSLDVSSFNTEKVTNMGYMFNNCSKLTSLDLSNFNTEKVANMLCMFYGCTKLTSLDVSNFNTEKVTNMSQMFYGCASLTSLNISNWNVEKVTSMNSMFFNCTSLVSLDLSNWNTIAIEDIASMFNACYVLEEIKGIENFNTDNVTSMSQTFRICRALKTLDLSKWNDTKVATMDRMFQQCLSLETLDVSGFTGALSSNYSYWFEQCGKLKNVDLSNFNFSSTDTFVGMFSGNAKIENVGMIYSSAESINTLASLLPKPTNVFYHDADELQLTPIDGVTFRKYVAPSTMQLPPHIHLHSFPDGTRDEVDIKTGILTRNIGRLILDGSTNKYNSALFIKKQSTVMLQCNAISDMKVNSPILSDTLLNGEAWDTEVEAIDCHLITNTVHFNLSYKRLEGYELTLNGAKAYLNDNPITVYYQLKTPTTEQLILNYNNSCDYGRILPTGMCDKYDVVNSIYTQTMTSILLDGENTWDAMEEFENTIKFTAIGATVGVENLNMLGAGGLYCDNDLFPNINDDSDVEHCRVGKVGNKFYIYISKDRLISPDLIGYQIWLQENKFNMIYELAEHITYNKPYEELDPTQARWEGMDCMRDGAIRYHANNSDNITLYPTLEYVAPSINNFEVPMLKPNTEYTIYAEGINEGDTINFGGTDINFNNGTVYTSGDNQWLKVDNNDSFYNMVITRGDTTGEHVPYFEGMASVEMPVLTTIGKNLFDVSRHGSLTPQPTGDIQLNSAEWGKYDVKYILKPNTQYTLTILGDGTKCWIAIFVDGSSQSTNMEISYTKTFSTNSNGEVTIGIYANTANYVGYSLKSISIEEGTVSTPYEPYKSTTVNEPVALRSLPNGLKDTINVVTGEYVQRVGEVVLNGSEDWTLSAYVNSTSFYIPLNNLVHKVDYLNSMSCDKLVVHTDERTLQNSISPNGISAYADWTDGYPNENWIYIKYEDSKGSVEKLKQWLKENPVTVQYELAEPIITKLDPQTLLAYEDGTINLSSDTGILPTVHYTVPSTNTFHLPSMKTGTRYTLKYPSASGSITIGDINYSISSDSMLFTTPLKINGDTSAIIFSDANPENVILLEGAYNKREVPFFTGVKSVKNPNITIIDQLSTESTTYNCETEIELRGLPNGVADKLDIIKGKLTTNVGIRPYQEGDENLPNIWTDGYETVYALSSPVVTNVAIDRPTVTTNSLIELSSDYLIPQLNYRTPSSNNFPLDLLQPNTTYTLYADTLTSGSYILGGTKTGIYSQPHTITLGDTTDNLLTFNGDLGLSNVMLVKGNSLKTSLPPYFLGIRSVTDGHLLVEGMVGEMNELTFDEGIVLRDCNGVKDTIDLITCTLTKRTGEITLTGAEGWYREDSESTTDYNVFKLTLGGLKQALVMCDTLQSVFGTKAMDCIYAYTNELCIVIANATIGGDTVNALKSWLNQHPTTVIYPLATPIEVQLKNVWTTLPPTSYDNQTKISSTVSSTSLKPMISVTIATTTLEEIVSQLEQQNAELQAQNESLEQENIATMLALTEVYELIYTPLAATTEPQVATYGLRRGVEPIGMSVSPIGMVYARLVNKGLKSIDEVPYNLQVEVMYALRGME